MKLLTVTNLYPLPQEPQRGLFNAHLFRALAEELKKAEGCRLKAEGHKNADSSSSTYSLQPTVYSLTNICLAPEWRIWRWRTIRQWRDPFCPALQTMYCPTFYLPLVGRNMSWRFYLRALRGVRNRMAASETVLATWLYPDAVAVAQLATELGKPVWIRIHGSDRFHLRHPVRGRSVRRACEQARGIICNCRYMAEQMIAAGLPPEKVFAVPNGVDPQTFRYRPREEARRTLLEACFSLQPSAFSLKLVLFVGNLAPVKAPDVLLAAWRALRSMPGTNPKDLHLAVIGAGPLRPALETQARRWGIAESVHWLGRRPSAEVALWMNAADVLCLSSDSEGMPNVVVEALVSGLPVAATDVGGTHELLAGEPAARLAPARDPAGLAGALAALLAAPIDRAQLAGRYATRYSWTEQAHVILNILSG
jgi:glycosyltransferase involved in cell wall biosynthesis